MVKRDPSPFHEWIQSDSWRRLKSVGLTGLKGSSKAYLLSLWRQKEKGPCLIIVPSIQKVLPPSDLKGSIFHLQVGEEISREDLIRFLQENKYTSVRIVEERGDYSLRGAIIDLSSPFYEEPLRLEFGGDHLTSLRHFEPENQRSIPGSDMAEAILLPARDISKDLFEQPLGSFFAHLN